MDRKEKLSHQIKLVEFRVKWAIRNQPIESTTSHLLFEPKSELFEPTSSPYEIPSFRAKIEPTWSFDSEPNTPREKDFSREVIKIRANNKVSSRFRAKSSKIHATDKVSSFYAIQLLFIRAASEKLDFRVENRYTSIFEPEPQLLYYHSKLRAILNFFRANNFRVESKL